MKIWKGAAIGAAVLCFALPQAVQAKPPWLTTFNNLYGTRLTKLNTCRICHTASVPARNPYGAAFKIKLKAGNTVRQSLVKIQSLDSDRDGFANLREIRARTFPGNRLSHP